MYLLLEWKGYLIMMENIPYFDYCAVLLIAILITTSFFRKMTKGRENRCYLLLLSNCFVAALFDILSIELDAISGSQMITQYVVHTIYLFTHTVTPMLYMIYVNTLTDTWHCYRNWAAKVVLIFPFPLLIIALLCNFFTHDIFVITTEGDYVRGSLFWLLYVIAFFYMLTSMLHVIAYHKLFNKRKLFSLLIIFPVLIAALLVQYVYPWCLIEMFATAMSLVFVSLVVQSPESLLDTATGFGNVTHYMEDTRQRLLNGKSQRILLLNVINFVSLREMLGYAGIQEFTGKLSDMIETRMKQLDYGAEYYYLGDGKFRLAVYDRYNEQTEQMAEKLLQLFSVPVTWHQMTVNVTVSTCIMDCPQDIDDVEVIMAFGNELFKEKYARKIVYAKDVYQKDHYDLMNEIDRIIEKALASHQFQVYYQPIYSVKEKRFQSAEALLRLIDDKYGFISPELLIRAAEKSGAIHKIGSYVLEEVCRFISSEEYQALGLDYIEINLSVAQCMNEHLAEEILQMLKHYNVPVEQINLEITETAASYSQNTMISNIQTLSDAGIKFSLDDYGTGYSNMGRIISLPFHIVKLDKTLADACGNDRMHIVLENTIRMIKDMNMEIVVEGIETEQLAEVFSALQCEYIQGYYYSRPLPEKDFITFIKQEKK